MMNDQKEPHLRTEEKTTPKKEDTRPGGVTSPIPNQYFTPGVDDDDAGGPSTIRGK